MAGELSREGAALALKVLLGIKDGGQPPQPPAQTYLALLKTQPTPEALIDGLDEITDLGYMRLPVSWNVPTPVVPSMAGNTSMMQFGPFEDDSPAVSFAALVSTPTGVGGSYFMWWELERPAQALRGQTLQIAPGRLTRTIT